MWNTPSTIESVIEYIVAMTTLGRVWAADVVKRHLSIVQIGINNHDYTWKTGDAIIDVANLTTIPEYNECHW